MIYNKFLTYNILISLELLNQQNYKIYNISIAKNIFKHFPNLVRIFFNFSDNKF